MQRRKDNKNAVLKEGEYQRSNGTYEYRWKDRLGKSHSVYAKTLPLLRKKEEELFKNSMNGLDLSGQNITLNDLFYRWKVLKRGLKENTYNNYVYMYTNFVEPSFGKTKIINIKRSDVRWFYNYLHENNGLQINTIDTLHTVVHQVLEMAVEDNYLPSNPSDKAMTDLKRAYAEEKKGEKKRDFLTRDEQKLLETYLKENVKYNRWWSIVVFMLWTGVRISELCSLQWDDIDEENNMIYIRHNLVYYKDVENGGMKYTLNSPKTDQAIRYIPMLPIVKDALNAEKRYQKEVGITCTTPIEGKNNFVFLNRFGECFKLYTINKALHRIQRDCNFKQLDQNETLLLPHLHNHMFRKTFATRMCEQGLPIKVVQEILGHADAQTTLNIYAGVTKDFVQETAQAMSLVTTDLRTN